MIRCKRDTGTGALLGAAMLALAACGSDSSTQSIVPGATLELATSTALGTSYLVDGKGRSLYLFAHDLPAGGGQAAQSSCVADPDPTRSCVAFWPIFHADPLVVAGIDAHDVGEIVRADGLKQTTYKGFPLYYYAGDQNPGDTNGDASTGGGPTPVWFVVRQPAYTVMTLTDSSGATRLTDGAGRTLYDFGMDTVGPSPVSACAGTAGDRTTCVGNWPPFSASSIVVPTGIDASRFSRVVRADGMPQLAFDGHPLYAFADDQKPGDVLGLTFPPGLGFWFTIDPNQSTASSIKTRTHVGAPFDGDHLVDANERTLYYLAKDVPASAQAGAVSNCVADADPSKSCLAFWPVFHAANAIVQGVNRNDIGELIRPDGLAQTTYKGFPLYYFVGDTRAGDVNGEASTGGGPSPIWFVLRNPAYTELVLSKATEDADYLADASGLSLYISAQDTIGTATTPPVSACEGACLTTFPIFLGATATVVPSILDPADFTVFTRRDGQQQSAYRGHPLYRYSGDRAPGETSGRGAIEGFATADPSAL